MSPGEDRRRRNGGPATEPLRLSPVSELPTTLAVGGGTALFLDGLCSHPRAAVEGLRVVLDGREHPVLGSGMPPPGHTRGDEYWWSIVDVPPITEPRVAWAELRATLADGREASGRLGAVELLPRAPAARPDRAPSNQAATEDDGPLVAICIAAFEPPQELFRRQIDSIRAQTHRNWVCLISDDSSSPAGRETIAEAIEGDERFALSIAAERAGFYRNFERALTMVPAEAEYVALCDQDDRWYPDKLEALLAGLEDGSRLVYSDMRIVEDDGTPVSETYWRYRRNNHDDFGALMLANTITGAASLFDRGLLDDALPFPRRQGNAYHDHWIAQTAMALGDVSYVDRPLYEYVQHGAAALGHERANARAPATVVAPVPLRDRLARLRRRGAHPGWRGYYFSIYCRLRIAARVLLMRGGERIDPGKRRVLRRLAGRRPPLAWLLVRAARGRLGATETLGRERAMLSAIAWRRFAELRRRARRRRPVERPPAAGGPGLPSAEDDEPWLTPILVDYFSRDGSTSMMELLATSPGIAVEDAYPHEQKYFAYLWRWAHVLERTEWPEERWGARDLGSLNQFQQAALVGPPPWHPRLLIEPGPGEPALSERLFESAWREFSRLASERTRQRHGGRAGCVLYYAEKHLNTWMVDLEALPPVRLVVLLRDPRDTWVSINAFNRARGTAALGRDRTATEEEHLSQILARQRERLRWISELLERDDVPVVRYEELVRDPEGLAERLGSWLGVDLDPAAARRDNISRHATADSPEASIGRWRTELDDATVELFERELSPELRAVGLEA